MGFFSTRRKSPPAALSAEDFLLWVTKEDFGIREATLHSALDQDLKIIGDDSDEFVLQIVDRYGDWVRYWPWDRFLCFDEAVPILALFAALWDLLRLPWGETAVPRKPALERLELGHIAKVFEHGEWIEP
ncbi:MAG: hypothetical protein AAGG56_18410 [Pseudomonadota bacterium]